MKTISSLSKIRELITQYGDDLYVRWGNPKLDNLVDGLSRNCATGRSEAGISCSRWWSEREDLLYRWLGEYQFLRINGEEIVPYLLTGEEVGKGGDGEPVIANGRALAIVSEDLVKTLDEIEVIRLRVLLAQDRERLKTLTDKFAISSCVSLIADYEAKLAKIDVE